jgi:hypothetical protein
MKRYSDTNPSWSGNLSGRLRACFAVFPPRSLARLLAPLLACSLLVLLPACSSPPTSRTLEVSPSQSADAFSAALTELRERRFVPERIDAQAGVITTQPKRTGGLVSPWDSEQSSLADEFEDTFHYHTRTVRITIAPVAPPADLANESRDLFLAKAPIRIEVEAFVARRQTPHMQPQPRVLGLTTQAIDPTLSPRGMTGAYDVSLSRDDDLAASIAQGITRRLAQHN